MGREISIPFPPKRIVSLVPSQTELLFDLGLDGEIVGITKFCVHPKEKTKVFTKIGGTKKFNFRKINELKPDLIIGNKEENYLEGIKELEASYPVWMSDISNLSEALDMILRIGKITGKNEEAIVLRSKIENSFEALSTKVIGRAVYIIWKDPIMVTAKDTFIDEMLKYAGVENAVNHLSRYPILTLEELKFLEPDFVFLSTEPYPFKEKHIKEFEGICGKEKVKLVDGEIFSWYGSRLLIAADYFHALKSELQSL